MAAEMAAGEWILVYDRDDSEVYYNDAIEDFNGGKRFAMWTRLKKGDRSAANAADTAKYYWVNTSCANNQGSIFFKPEISVKGEWLSPQNGRPGGAGMTVRKKYCD